MDELPPSAAALRLLVKCSKCTSEKLLTLEELQALLYQRGLLRRMEKTDTATLLEIARGAASRLSCDECTETGLLIRQATSDDVQRIAGGGATPFDDEDGEWGDPKPCSRCRKLIPAERVALFPHITLCVECQQSDDRGEDSAEADYCPRCGTPRTLRKSSGRGIAHYENYCPTCRR